MSLGRHCNKQQTDNNKENNNEIIPPYEARQRHNPNILSKSVSGELIFLSFS